MTDHMSAGRGWLAMRAIGPAGLAAWQKVFCLLHETTVLSSPPTSRQLLAHTPSDTARTPRRCGWSCAST